MLYKLLFSETSLEEEAGISFSKANLTQKNTMATDCLQASGLAVRC